MPPLSTVFAPVMQGGTTRLGCGGKVGCTTMVNHRDIQEDGISHGVGQRSPQCQPAPPSHLATATAGDARIGHNTCIPACASRDVAESLLPAIVPRERPPLMQLQLIA
jgi:hypothetical protein